MNVSLIVLRHPPFYRGFVVPVAGIVHLYVHLGRLLYHVWAEDTAIAVRFTLCTIHAYMAIRHSVHGGVCRAELGHVMRVIAILLVAVLVCYGAPIASVGCPSEQRS